MLNMEVKSNLPSEKIIEKLKGFFGKGGLGLSLADESSQCLSFHGGGGYVTATLCPDGKGTRIDFVSQEWDVQVKNFASDLK